MGRKMIVRIADNIVSPLGYTTADNYSAVKQGMSALHYYDHVMDIPEPFTASLFDHQKLSEILDHLTLKDEYTRFENIVILSIYKALKGTDIDVKSDRVLFVISTTKGNVELLDSRSAKYPPDRIYLGKAAKRIAEFFGNTNEPIVVSNACISGLCAQITAMRTLERGFYDYAIVVGADVQSRFIISGFQSFKALSTAECKPFDEDRNGLNLGEAAATIIYKRTDSADGYWMAVRGAIRNDATHISCPSKKGEGSYRTLKYVISHEDIDRLALINVHGTSTLYNDEMESVAITRAGLQNVPVNTLKGFYGHTMGAAGILETVLSMASLDDHTILATRGYENSGVSCPLNITNYNRQSDKKYFIKLISGFGGCNAAMLFKKGGSI